MVPLLDTAFPDDRNLPVRAAECSKVLLVAAYVGEPLGAPECLVGRRSNLAILAAVHVPETPVNENNLAEFRKYKVRLAGKVRKMEAVPVTNPVEHRADALLGPGVTPANTSHLPLALLGSEYVSHSGKLPSHLADESLDRQYRHDARGIMLVETLRHDEGNASPMHFS